MIASLTFDVELTPLEARGVRMVIEGRTDGEIARALQITVERVKEMFYNMRLATSLSLIDATRDRRVTWTFESERKTA
jgi:hypothetical protein